MKGEEKRSTPSSRRREVAKRRSQKQAKKRAAVKNPSWKEALKRRYTEAARAEKTSNGETSSGKLKAWEHGRAARKAAKRRKDAEVASDIEDDDDEFGVNPEAGMEIQDDVDEDREKRLNERQPLAAQLFVKGLPTTESAEALQAQFGKFGAVAKVFVIKNNMTKMATGAAFIHFKDAAGADALYSHAQQNARDVASDTQAERAVATEGLSKHKAKMLLHKLKQDSAVSKEPFIYFGTTRASVFRAQARTENAEFTASMHKGKQDKKKRTPTGGDDPRNLYLLQEGFIEEGTPAATGLAPRVLGILRRDYEQRKMQLRNVNYFVSKTRLSVRNLPRGYKDGDLRKLFLDAIRPYLKEHPEVREKKRWGKHGPVKQCRVMIDGTGGGKGYGFIEFLNHNVALRALRQLNNNPTVFGKNQRPVVNFAVENANAIDKMARMKVLRKQREEQKKMSGFYTS